MPANPWSPGDRSREPAVLGQPIKEGAAWLPKDFKGAEPWAYQLSDDEVEDVLAAVAALEGREILSVTKDDFPLPRLADALADVGAELRDGRGFAMLRGLPIDGRTLEQTAIAFWGLGLHLGAPISQNDRGHLLGHVTDLGVDPANVRGYMTSEALAFHTDRADLLSLCCLTAAKSGGQHRVCSSVSLHNEMLKRRPELVHELAWEFYRSRTGEIPAGETKPWYRQPIFSVKDGYFAARGASLAMKRAQSMPGVPKLTDAQVEAIELFQSLCDEIALDIDLAPGDITYVNCHVTQHARSDYEDWPQPERKRHLLRLWLHTGARPLVDSVLQDAKGVVVEGMTPVAPLEAA